MRLPVLTLLALAACGPNPRTATLAPDGLESTAVRVQNETPGTLRVFALIGGMEQFLGRAEPMTETTLELPLTGHGEVYLVARPSVDMGSDRRHVSEAIQIPRGGVIGWRLHASPGSASLPRISTVKLQLRK